MSVEELLLPFVACRADIPEDPRALLQSLIHDMSNSKEIKDMKQTVAELEDEVWNAERALYKAERVLKAKQDEIENYKKALAKLEGA